MYTVKKHTTRKQRIDFLNAWYAVMPRTAAAVRQYNQMVCDLL